MPRKVTFTAGVKGGATRELTVEVHDLDVDPWGVDAELRVVGTDAMRPDAPLKATGRAVYTSDVRPNDMAYARLVRSPYASAKVVSIDVSAAERRKGVLAVTVLTPPGRQVTFAGQGVAAICAETEEILDDAVHDVVVEYEAGRPLVTTDDALAANGRPSGKPEVRGDPDAALAAARHRVAATFRTQVQTHSALESHGCVVVPNDDDTFTVFASTQGTESFQQSMARHLNVPTERVRVITEHMGGGFGAKLGGIDQWDQAAATFARDLKRPVRGMLDRREEHLVAGCRPDSVQELELGCDADGRITVLKGTTYGTAGNGNGGAGAANTRVYPLPNLRMEQATVPTHTGRARAFRAPGHPQGLFALEGIVDMLAVERGEDPLEFRLRNDPHPVRQVQWREGAERIRWKETRREQPGSDEGPVKRGVGCASGIWYQRGRGDFVVNVRIGRDGGVTVTNGVQDIGTGTRGVLAMLVAEELGIAPASVTVVIGDTRYPPGPASGGSTTAPSIGPAAREAGAHARQALRERVARAWEVPDEKVSPKDGGFTGPDGRSVTFAQACALLDPSGVTVSGQRRPNYEGFSGETAGCQFAQVAVDTDTGVVRVEKVVAVHDAGRIVNTLTARSQVIGGVIQGISYALFEDRQLDRRLGDMVNPTLDTYRVLGMADCPEIVAVLTTMDSGFNNAGMMGLGEPVTVPTAGAVANAVANAIGVRVNELPITPARVLAALGRSR